MKINTSLRQFMEAVEQELFGYGVTNANLAVALHEEAYAAWNKAVRGEHFDKIKPLKIVK